MNERIALATAVAALLGSVPTGWIVAHRSTGADVRDSGSGGIGATNVLRAAGPAAAIATLLVDAGKGFLAVAFAAAIGAPFWAVAAAAPVAAAAHAWTPWLSFRGGRGVATGAGSLGALSTATLGISLGLFVTILVAGRRVSVASIVAAASFPALAALRGEPRATILAGAAVAAIVIWRHREHLARLRAGTEPAIGEALRRWRGGRP